MRKATRRVRIFDRSAFGRLGGFAALVVGLVGAYAAVMATWNNPGLIVVFGLLPAGLAFVLNPVAYEAWRDRTRKVLSREPKVVMLIVEPQTSNGIAGIFSGFFVLAAIVAGAILHEHSHVRFTSVIIAAVVLVTCALGTSWLILARKVTETLTLGLDGLTLSDRSFVPFSNIRDVEVEKGEDDDIWFTSRDAPKSQDALKRDVCIHKEDDTTVRVAAGGFADTLREEILRRKATTIDVPFHPLPETDFRTPAVPVGEMVRTLRDTTVPREERIRVAVALRVHAPEEVEQVANETADPELARELRSR